MEENTNWLSRRVGYISASKLGDLMTKGRSKDKAWGDSAISYLHRLAYERKMQREISNDPFIESPYTGYHTDSPAMRFGRDNEQYAVDWIRRYEFEGSKAVRYYETDFPEKPFITVDWAKFGVTPDCDVYVDGQIKALWEIKCCYSEDTIYKYFSPISSPVSLEEECKKEHLWQVLGQMLAVPSAKFVAVLKYNPPRDDYDWDMADVTDFSRGRTFFFRREDYQEELAQLKERIIFADSILEHNINAEKVNELWNEKHK